MTNLDIIHLLLGSGGLLGILISLIFFSFRTGKIIQQINTLDADVKELRKETREEFWKIRKENKDELENVRMDIRSVQANVSDVKERVTFMETFIFFSEFTAESNNPRSEAAKEMWKRRKQKTLEAKLKGK